MGHSRLQTELITQSDPECPFCRIVKGEDPHARIVFRTAGAVGFFPTEPASPGHTLVVPAGHVTRLWDMPREAIREVMDLLPGVAQAVIAATGAQGLNLVQSNGAVASQSVDHVHFHLVPRWDDDPIRDFWPAGPLVSGVDQRATLEAVRLECARVIES